MFEKPGYDEIPSLSSRPLKENGTGAVADSAGQPAARELPRPSISPKVDIPEAPTELQPASSAGNDLPANVISVLSASVVVKGEISADDEIVIHGKVEGTIAHDMKKVVVAKGGQVRALIHANVVSVQGHVDGDIHASERVELLEGARVEGDIYSPMFSVERGARFNGTVNMPPPSPLQAK